MRIGIGGGNRLLRGGVNVGRGGVRAGVGVGPFHVAGGGGRRRGRSSGGSPDWDEAADAFGPVFIGIFLVMLALISYALVGSLVLASVALLAAVRPTLVSRRIPSKRLRSALGISDWRISRTHAFGLCALVVSLEVLFVASNIGLSLLTTGIRGDHGLGDTGVSNFCGSALVANLLVSLPLILLTCAILVLRTSDSDNWERAIHRPGPAGGLASNAQALIVSSLGGIAYGIIVGIVGDQLLYDYYSHLGELIRDLPGLIAAGICLTIAIAYSRHDSNEWSLYLAIPIALSSGAIAFDSAVNLEGNFGVVVGTGLIIVLCSITMLVYALIANRNQLLWWPSFRKSNQSVTAWICTFSLLAALWRSNPYSIGAILAALGPAYVSAVHVSRIITAMTVGSIAAIALRFTAVAIDYYNGSWDPLGVIFLLAAAATGLVMIRENRSVDRSDSLLPVGGVLPAPGLISRRRDKTTRLSASEVKNEAVHVPRATNYAEGRQGSDGSPTADQDIDDPVTPANLDNTETLICTECGSEWTRIRTRGRKPLRCPTCRG